VAHEAGRVLKVWARLAVQASADPPDFKDRQVEVVYKVLPALKEASAQRV
jgi:hypothetical protein